MGRPNNWREKRLEQHETHNRKPGAARFWKEQRNRKGRRWGTRLNKYRKESFDEQESKPKVRNRMPKENTFRPKPIITGSIIADLLDEETVEELRDI